MSRHTLRFSLVLVVLAVTVADLIMYFVMGSTSDAPKLLPPTVSEVHHVQTINGETVVVIAPEVLRASGIDVAPLAFSPLQAEHGAYATVIDLQPLFDLDNRLAAAHVDYDSAYVQAVASQAQYERMQTLYKDDRNASLKNLQDAHAVAQLDHSRVFAAENVIRGLTTNLRQQFGRTLANAVTAPGSSLVRQLSNGLAAVVRVTLPADSRTDPPARMVIDDPGGQAMSARMLSATPQVDLTILGRSYFYLTERFLPTGLHTIAHGEPEQKSASGLVMPDSAIVWYGGQRWVYVRTASDHFTRRLVLSASAAIEGVVVTNGFRAGDEVVIHGAQVLLSEEQRPQGVTTQCKDPPECDD